MTRNARKEHLVEETLASGITPLTRTFRKAYHCANRKYFAGQSILQINTVGCGVLEPEQYTYLTDRTKQSTQIFSRHMELICDALSDLAKAGKQMPAAWIYAPPRLLAKEDAVKIVRDVLRRKSFRHPENLVLAFPADILWFEVADTAGKLAALKDLGVRTAITGVGDGMCPILLLRDMHADCICLHENVTRLMSGADTRNQAKSLISFISETGAELYAVDVPSPEVVEWMFRSGVTGFWPHPKWKMREGTGGVDNG